VSRYCAHVEVFFYTADYYRRLSSLLSKWTQVFSPDISHTKNYSPELCFAALETGEMYGNSGRWAQFWTVVRVGFW